MKALLRTTPAVLTLAFTCLACASGGGSAGPGDFRTAGDEGPGIADDVPVGAERTEELAELHDRMRVPGIEDRRFQPEAYWEVVMPVLASSEAIAVEQVGESAEGRPLREVRFGTGPIRVLLWSQMHGDESTASMALADIFNLLSSGHPLVEELGERLSLHFIPLLNPDGAARFQRRNALGVDVNRDARRLATPEGRTLKAVRDRVEPDFAFNLHDQNVRTRVGRSDRGAAIALLAPAFDEERNVNALRERAMRVASAIKLSIDPLVGDHIARYNDAFNARAFGDLMSAWGSSAILIESGGWQDDPQKQYLRRVNFVGIVSALEVIASETWDGVPTWEYDNLPENGRSVDDLLLVGGTIAAPGLPEMRADVLVNYARPLLREGGRVGDVGDLGGYEAREVIDLTGLYLVPTADALDPDGALKIGAPADFVISRDAAGRDVVWRFEGGPPEGMGGG